MCGCMYLNSLLTCPLLYPFSFFSPSCIPYSPPSLFITRNLRFFLISISSLIRCCQSMWCWIHLMPCFKRPTRRCHQCMVVSHSTSSGNSSTTSYPTSATTQLLTGINYSYVITGACVCACVCVCDIFFPILIQDLKHFIKCARVYQVLNNQIFTTLFKHLANSEILQRPARDYQPPIFQPAGTNL